MAKQIKYSMEKKIKRRNRLTVVLILMVVLLVVTTLVGIIGFRSYINNLSEEKTGTEYQQYYAMIVDERESAFWQSIYEAAFEAGKNSGIYIDLFGTNAFQNKNREALMEIAIAADVDGIILEADEGEAMTALINRATEEGIPVVTVYKDSANSARCSYVGVGNYDIGQEYGRRVLAIADEFQRPVSVAVLTSENAKDSGQNAVYSGIQDTVDLERKKGVQIELEQISVDDSNAFAAEESIRDIFTAETLPDIIICLNERNTICVYQTVVDYNKVGQVQILGYYDSEAILTAIERDVIYATIAVDTEQMGEYCVAALQEYYSQGYTSQYFSADILLIDRNNAKEYPGRKTK